jgi:aldose 1-epimerase
MVAPSGEQFEISGAGYRAVVTESGATLRALTYNGRELVDGFSDDKMPSAGRGQWLIPWPNRIRDGAYSFGDRDHQLPLSEPARNNASHGLVRWTAWRPIERAADSVTLGYRLMAQSGYPWTLDLTVRYVASAAGLEVRHTAINRADSPAPYAVGMHPYLTAGTGPVDDWELTLPAATRAILDDRMLPIGREPVAKTSYDFRQPTLIGSTVLDDAFTDLTRGADGLARVEVRDPRTGTGAGLWLDQAHRWLQVYSGDAPSAGNRRALAVEPMTSPADAFRSGDDLLALAPGEEFSAAFGIYALP